MILQYEGFSKSKTQILEEAESISYTYVTIPEWVKKDIKREFDREVKSTCETSDAEDMERIKFYGKKILNYIKIESNCVGMPTMKIQKDIFEMFEKTWTYIVVNLFGQGNSKTYIFEEGQQIYLLNSNGKTIKRL